MPQGVFQRPEGLVDAEPKRYCYNNYTDDDLDHIVRLRIINLLLFQLNIIPIWYTEKESNHARIVV